MKLGRYVLAACVLLTPTLAVAQDFGVMESAETIDKGTFKLKVNPMFLVGDDDTRPGLAAGFGYGFTDKVDFEANFARYEDLTLIGANAEYWLVKDPHPVDLSVSAGLHFGKSDFGDYVGVDLNVIGSHAATPKLDVYAALDLAINHYRDSLPDSSFTQAHIVPGIEYKIHPDLDLLGEFGIALNDEGSNYLSFGIAYYLR
jgi:hypothetical protein